MLVVDRELIILLRATVAFCCEELNVGLRRGEAHGIAAGRTWRRVPDVGIGQPVIETSKGKRSKGEGREESALGILPELVRLVEGVTVVNEVVCCDAGLLCLVEDEDNL